MSRIQVIRVLWQWLGCIHWWHEKHFGILFQPRFKSFLMVHKEAGDYSTIHYRSWIHSRNSSCKSSFVVKKVSCDLHILQNHMTKIFIDNQAVIAISKDPVCHGKTKNFNIKLYFLREIQQNGEVILVYCKSEDQLADLFTKPLPVSKFELLRQKIGVCRS